MPNHGFALYIWKSVSSPSSTLQMPPSFASLDKRQAMVSQKPWFASNKKIFHKGRRERSMQAQRCCHAWSCNVRSWCGIQLNCCVHGSKALTGLPKPALEDWENPQNRFRGLWGWRGRNVPLHERALFPMCTPQCYMEFHPLRPWVFQSKVHVEPNRAPTWNVEVAAPTVPIMVWNSTD